MSVLPKICEAIIPVKAVGVRYIKLEPHLLNTPAIALSQTAAELRKMLKRAWKMTDTALKIYAHNDERNQERVKSLPQREEEIDARQHDIADYLTALMLKPLSPRESRQIPVLIHCTNDAERIADHTANIMRLTKRLSKVDTKLSDVAQDNLNSLWDLLSSQAENVKLALSHKHDENEAGIRSALEGERKLNKLAHKYEKNIKAMMAAEQARDQQEAAHVASDAEANEREINELAKQYEQVHVERRNNGQCAVDANVIFIEMLWELERIGDHLVNIAQRAPEMQKFYINI